MKQAEPLKDFYDGAFRIAIETQTPIKPLLLVDTADRMHYRGLFELTPGINRVVYLEEVPVEGLTMKDIQSLKQKVYAIMDSGLRRYRSYPSSP
jgi:1-acyl-sn-glycerol-3-phosphate acyltransferase